MTRTIVVTSAGKHSRKKGGKARHFATNWQAVVALTARKQANRSLKVDLSVPRSLLFVLRNARMDCIDRGVTPSLKAIMEGPYADAVRTGLENCIDLVGVWDGRRIPFPLEEAQADFRKLLSEMFSNPAAVSPEMPKPAQPFVLAFVGKPRLSNGSGQAQLPAGKK